MSENSSHSPFGNVTNVNTNKKQVKKPAVHSRPNMDSLMNDSSITSNLPQDVVLAAEKVDPNAVEQQKIEKIGKPLKEWNINIYRGILTGFNEAFIINGATKDALIAEDPKVAKLYVLFYAART